MEMFCILIASMPISWLRYCTFSYKYHCAKIYTYLKTVWLLIIEQNFVLFENTIRCYFTLKFPLSLPTLASFKVSDTDFCQHPSSSWKHYIQHTMPSITHHQDLGMLLYSKFKITLLNVQISQLMYTGWAAESRTKTGSLIPASRGT